jgi:hypothetical protein
MLDEKSPIQNSISQSSEEKQYVGSTLIINVLCGKKATYIYFIILIKRQEKGEFQLPRTFFNQSKIWETHHSRVPKGVGRGPTLAWPGWKQPDISVKVDTARLEAGQFKKCCMECVLLYYPSTEF